MSGNTDATLSSHFQVSSDFFQSINGMTRKRYAVYGVVVIGATLFLFLCVISWGVLSLHAAFADDQTAFFEEMVHRAETSLAESPPNIRAAKQYREAIETYYPSGTKQVVGSKLDRVVERMRMLSKRHIDVMIECAEARAKKQDGVKETTDDRSDGAEQKEK